MIIQKAYIIDPIKKHLSNHLSKTLLSPHQLSYITMVAQCLYTFTNTIQILPSRVNMAKRKHGPIYRAVKFDIIHKVINQSDALYVLGNV